MTVAYEAIRKWCCKFGQQYATQLRCRRPRPGDKWHLDEVFLTSKSEHHYLWRAVDQEENVPNIMVQRHRDKQAEKKFFCKLLKRLTHVLRMIVTDKLKSYGAAKREIYPILAAHGLVVQHFCPRHSRLTAPPYREEMQKQFQSWREITSPALVA